MTAQARRKAPLVALFAAEMVSLTGNMMTMVAIPWFVLQTTGSAARTGIVAAAGLVPIVVSGFMGGALVDRLGYRRASIVADLASSGAVAAIPLLHVTVGLAAISLAYQGLERIARRTPLTARTLAIAVAVLSLALFVSLSFG